MINNETIIKNYNKKLIYNNKINKDESGNSKKNAHWKEKNAVEKM